MEAKQTVMKDSELFAKMRDKFLGLDAETDVDWDLIKITKEAQAEISFKAGESKESLRIQGCLAGCPWKLYKSGDVGIRIDKKTFTEIFGEA